MAQRKESIEKGIPYQPRTGAGRRGPRPQSQGPRPHVWLVGPDPRRHAQYHAYLVHRAQANYRNEGHELTFEQWETIWNTDSAWENRGRGSDNVCMIRMIDDKPWAEGNVIVVSRKEQLFIQSQNRVRANRPRKPRKDKGSKRLNYNRKS